MKQLKYFLGLLFFITQFSFGHKKPIDHSVYDLWNDIQSPIISNNGQWISYEVNPQDGDGVLLISEPETGYIKKINRGYKAAFSPLNNFIVCQIKAQKDTVRAAKFAKVKEKNLPKDSLSIFNLNSQTFQKIPDVLSYKIPKEKSPWIVYLQKQEKNRSEDSLKTSKKTKNKGDNLVIFNPISSKKYEYKNVLDYNISKNGKLIGIISTTNDSIAPQIVSIFDTNNQDYKKLFEEKGECKKIICDTKGDQISFIHSTDTIKNKKYKLYYWNNNLNAPKIIAKEQSKGIPSGWCINDHSDNAFSEDGNKLYFNSAPIIEEEPEDTLLEEEKTLVDIWNWKDKRLQPQQSIELKDDQKKSYKAVYHIKKDQIIQLENELVDHIKLSLKKNCNYVIGISTKPYQKIISWDFPEYKDIYTININTGDQRKIINKSKTNAYMSPDGNYTIFFNQRDSIWYSYSLKKQKMVALTKNISVNFYDEIEDIPSDPFPYGFAGWLEDKKSVLIYDQFDIWKVHLDNTTKPINITKGTGRKSKTKYRYIKLDKEKEYISHTSNILLFGFNKESKKDGFFSLNVNNPEVPKKLISGDYMFRAPIKAKNANKFIWRKESFYEYSNLWISDDSFQNPKKISEANPQQKDYLWGTVDLVKWTSFDNIELKGLLYKPENIDTTKEYPMIVFFYEKYSDRLNRHYVPAPSGHSLNFINYVSNGYIVFVPDIVYKTGYPGQSAYNAIVSGTMAMIDRYNYIDQNKLGLQGFSWGGYQTAYLITQTNLYSAAMAGAPVSNMTSAYGGIRWRSGLSRMFQYERTQSRIGNTLWKKPLHYIENSPIFYVPKINTPVLILHNDADGAVPWYQGIEYFVALRRLNKPAWMLVYNDEGHSIERRPNRIDFEIRMKQFFDHYLKNAPIPKWMEEGIPAIKKGKELGYELQ